MVDLTKMTEDDTFNRLKKWSLEQTYEKYSILRDRAIINQMGADEFARNLNSVLAEAGWTHQEYYYEGGTAFSPAENKYLK